MTLKTERKKASMDTKTLIDKKDIEFEGHKYFISRIPAVKAQKIFLEGFGALTNKTMGSLPPAIMEDILSYCGTYNKEGAEVQFINSDIINMFITDMFVLLFLEHEMVRYNFSFLFDGRGEALADRLNSTLQNSPSKNTETSTL